MGDIMILHHRSSFDEVMGMISASSESCLLSTTTTTSFRSRYICLRRPNLCLRIDKDSKIRSQVRRQWDTENEITGHQGRDTGTTGQKNYRDTRKTTGTRSFEATGIFVQMDPHIQHGERSLGPLTAQI
jgi:hypothetical protein